MLRDLRELLESEEDEFPTPEDVRRRNILFAAAIGGGVLVVILLCYGIYNLLLGPRRQAARQTQIAVNQTQVAAISLADTQTATLPTRTSVPATPTPRTPTPQTPTETSSPSPALIITTTPTPSPVPTITPSPSATPTATPAPSTTPEAIFVEDFEGSGGVWPSERQENFEFGITGGQFRILVKTFFVDIWTVRQRQFGDVRLEVDLTRSAGPEEAYAGLVCRFQDNGNYFAMVVDGSGGYRLFKKRGGVAEDLGTPEQSGVIGTGSATNRLRADCVGDTLRFFVNGQLVLEVQDDTFSEGRVGLVAGTQAEPGLEVFFDNFLIANP